MNPPASSVTRRTVLLATGALAGAAALAGPAQACTVVEPRCGTITISRSGSDVVVVVKDASGAAAVGVKVLVRKGRGAFDEQETGKIGQTQHAIGVSSGDAVDVSVAMGGCTITKSGCVLT